MKTGDVSNLGWILTSFLFITSNSYAEQFFFNFLKFSQLLKLLNTFVVSVYSYDSNNCLYKFLE